MTSQQKIGRVNPNYRKCPSENQLKMEFFQGFPLACEFQGWVGPFNFQPSSWIFLRENWFWIFLKPPASWERNFSPNKKKMSHSKQKRSPQKMRKCFMWFLAGCLLGIPMAYECPPHPGIHTNGCSWMIHFHRLDKADTFRLAPSNRQTLQPPGWQTLSPVELCLKNNIALWNTKKNPLNYWTMKNGRKSNPSKWVQASQTADLFFGFLKMHPSVFCCRNMSSWANKNCLPRRWWSQCQGLEDCRIVRGMVGRAVGPAGCEVVCVELTWVWLVWWNLIKTRTSFQKCWKVGHERFQTFHQNFPRQLLPPFPVFSSGDKTSLAPKTAKAFCTAPQFLEGIRLVVILLKRLANVFFFGGLFSMNPWLNQKGLPPSLPPLPWPSLWDRTSKLPFFLEAQKTIGKAKKDRFFWPRK